MALTIFDPLIHPLTSLVQSLMATASGIVVNGDSIQLRSSGAGAVSLYDAAVGTPLGIGAGVLLTSGIAPGTTNTLTWYGADNSGSSGFDNGDADIDAVVNSVFQTQSYDATTLSFSFSVSDPLATSISFDLVFGSDEYPEWVDAFVDCGVVIVDGVNNALFNKDPLHPLSVISPNLAAGYFQDNGGNTIPIEYDGVSGRLRIVAPLKAGQTTHTIKIGIADTGDHILDSGLFIANMSAGRDPGSGVVSNPGGGSDGNDTCSGSAKDEYFDLKAGDDTIYAGGGADIIVAGTGNDSVFAGSGDDQLKGDGGDDRLDGGADLDTAAYVGMSADYGLVYDAADGSYRIDGTAWGEGVDVLLGVEQLQFSDGLFAFSAPGSTTLQKVVPGAPPPPPVNHLGLVTLSDATGQPFNGPVAEGATVLAVLSDADGLSGDETVQWFRDGQQIAGATAFQYSVQEGDANHSLAAQVSYSDASGHVESHTSNSLLVLAAGGGGEPVLSLMNVDGPASASVHTPLTTLLMSAIDQGETPNAAMQKIRAALQVPSTVPSLLSSNAFKILQSGVGDTASALALAKLEAQVAILCSTAIPNPANGSYSTDPSGAALTALLLERATNGQTFNLSSATDLLALHPELADSGTLDLLVQRNGHIAKAVKLLGGGDSIENEWADFISNWDLTLSQIPLSVLSQAINQAPSGSATAELPGAVAGKPFSLTTALLTQGFHDPDGDPLSVSALSTDQGDWFTDNGDGTWSLDATAPAYDPAYVGPLELHYTVDDGHGHSLAASQLLLVEPLNHAPTGGVSILGTASQGQTLIAVNDLVDADGIPASGADAIHYQWLVDGVALAGATGSALLLSQAEVGRTIRVSASYTDGHGTGETALSAATAAVANIDDEATGTLSLSGTAQEGETLSAVLNGLADPDGPATVAFRWQSLNGSTWSDLAGAVDAALTIPLGQGFAGRQVRVVATSSDPLGGTTEFCGDALSVAPALLPPPAPDFALLADTGSSTSDGITNNGTISVSGLIAGNTWQFRLNGGSWTTGTGSSFTLAAGSYGAGSIAVRQSNKAGASPSATNAAAISVDLTAPVAPSLALVADTGTSASDRITGNPNLAVGLLESGGAWEFSRDGGASWSGGSGSGFALPDGIYAAGAVRVRQRDTAGNLGPAIATTAALTIDTVAPVAPSFRLTSDTGSSGSDQISGNGAITVSGLINGHSWQYTSNGGGGWSALQPASTTSFSLAAGTYAAGSVAVRQSDVAGNTSPATSNSAPISIDVTLPGLTNQLVGGTSLVLRFSEPVAFPGGTAARFSVLNGKTAVAVNGFSVDAARNSVTLSLGSSIGSSSLLTVAYTDPSSANESTGVLEDLAGNDLASRSAITIRTFLASGSVNMASGFNSGYTGVELSGTAGAASLTGNASANELTGNASNNTLNGAGGADVLTGGGGVDDFRWSANADSLLGTSSAPGYDRIRDLTIGTDTLTLATSFAAAAGSISNRGTASALTASAIAAVLPSTSFAAATAAAFSLGSGGSVRTFLVLNDGNAGFQASSDALIEITGYSGSLGALAIL
ncbi:MAG: choice-of-anchor L domain-containing protein [Synechococcaceae cyanobacterium]|nr:choice-of-anchor L domain-containing protein [Synechococcaceae cyanobacterium]